MSYKGCFASVGTTLGQTNGDIQQTSGQNPQNLQAYATNASNVNMVQSDNLSSSNQYLQSQSHQSRAMFATNKSSLHLFSNA